MCGIVGYIGSQQAAPLLLEGLPRLEYRGYDSAGVAVLGAGLKVVKKAGRVRDLTEDLPKRFTGKIGIGHTRWATHGPANDVNAHPHVDAKGEVAVVHNGIIDNAAALRKRLTDDGVDLASDTDTEVLAHLIARSGADTLEGKVRDALSVVEGTYGIAVAARRLPRPDRRGPQRQPADHRGRRAGDVRRLRPRRAGALHDHRGAPRRRRDGHDHRHRVHHLPRGPHLHEQGGDHPRRRPGGVRRRRPRVVHAQGDPRAAGHGRAGAARPARRAVRHRAPRRAQPGSARDPRRSGG